MSFRRRWTGLLFLMVGALLLAACGGEQRLRLGADETVVEVRELAAGKSHSYRLPGREGQVLSLALVSPHHDLYLAVKGKDEGDPLLSANAKATRWSGILPATQDYAIEVGGSQRDTEYALAAALMPDIAPAGRHFAGMHHMTAPKASARHDLTLFLNDDDSAVLLGLTGVRTLAPFVMRGTWRAEGNTATVELVEQDGQAFDLPEIVQVAWHDGLLLADGDGVQSWRTAGLQFTPARGDYNSVVRTLHERLAAAGYLIFYNPGPGGNLFVEETRRSVVAFQQAQGLAAHGVAGPATWAALEITLLPTHTAAGEPIVYLTFDDGPDGRFTPQILDLLARYDAQATFFVLGEQALYYPDLVRAEAAAGHYVANHGFAHHAFDDMSREQLTRDIQKTEKLLREAAGDLFAWDGDVHFLRPPYGLTGDETQKYAAESGYVMVMWDIDSQDWLLPGGWAVALNVLNYVEPGDIVLMHDGGGDRVQTILALEAILEDLTARGYRFQSIFGH